jgi:hypothetical protein
MPDEVTVVPPNSWSADGRRLALNAFGPDPSAGTYVYEFETRQMQKVSQLAPSGGLAARWLSDNRRLLVANLSRLHLINTVTATSHEILSVWPDAIIGCSLSRDDQPIVFGLRSNKADIWLADLENGTTERQQ